MKTIVSAFAVCSGCVLVFAQGSAPAIDDQQFVDFAAQTDMLEANLGQLAATRRLHKASRITLRCFH